ncbi:helix-turn-helix domain-containing protein [Deinococcus sp.]|uniref:winged helix-turn-helix transcriptional regulator n=1 Tax=Deinococcus sp. TaxID=47478 RepID=UPI0025DCBC1C|nr:helix-turn-helix domain-containing protein [Deinococcus sp.]
MLESYPINTAPHIVPGYTAPDYDSDPELDALVREIIGRVADKWTMLALEVLEDHGTVRFTRLGELIGGISQKMLTKTLRQMEADGLLIRTVYPVIPPRVDYALTETGRSLGAAFCGVWEWAEAHRGTIQRSRQAFAERASQDAAPASADAAE